MLQLLISLRSNKSYYGISNVGEFCSMLHIFRIAAIFCPLCYEYINFYPDNLKAKKNGDLMGTLREVGARMMFECVDKGELSQAEKIIITLHKHAIPFYNSEVRSRVFIQINYICSKCFLFSYKSTVEEGY